jgi:hypothetical protein
MHPFFVHFKICAHETMSFLFRDENGHLRQEVKNLSSSVADVERRMGDVDTVRNVHQVEQLKVVIKSVAKQFQDLVTATLSMVKIGAEEVLKIHRVIRKKKKLNRKMCPPPLFF